MNLREQDEPLELSKAHSLSRVNKLLEAIDEFYNLSSRELNDAWLELTRQIAKVILDELRRREKANDLEKP